MSTTATMHATKLALSDEVREKAAEMLSTRLATLTDLFTQVKQAHWNVKGPSFIALHELFDEVADDVRGYVDDVAERIVQLGGTAVGTARATAASSELDEYPADIFRDLDHAEAVSARLAAAGKSVREGINIADDLDDDATEDLLTEIVRGLDKWLWFVEAHVQVER